ncbi:threonine synthase [Candidatus Uhrbacteria bacterium]|nr:threonine synthase [Candidatus Uhrbacteria bacterium]
MKSVLKCVQSSCERKYPLLSGRNLCECGGLLEVDHSEVLAQLRWQNWMRILERRWGAKNLPDSSGVWRYRDLILPGFPDEKIISRAEGNTRVYEFSKLAEMAAVRKLMFKHEGENPTGSFKDRGMTVVVSWAKHLGSRALLCASTGNTAASVASYARAAGMRAYILMPSERVALGKVSQAIAYGARVIKVRGNFDACMKLVAAHGSELGLHVVNSINPVRLEGQKTIIWELLEQLHWQLPNWIILPGGNLGNVSAFGKALREIFLAGVIDYSQMPRLAVIQAKGANPFYRAFRENFTMRFVLPEAKTIASAIEIGVPINHSKAAQAIRFTRGVVEKVSDEEIMEAKALLDREGVGAEPASCATLAGLLKLRASGIIEESDFVVCILTGHFLKDQTATLNFHESDSPLANRSVVIEPTLDELKKVL